MAQLYPYFNFENTKEALAYYKQVFGATILSRTPGQKEMLEKMGITKNPEDTTMHSMFSIHDNVFMASDRFGKAMAFTPAMSIMIDYNSEDEGEVARMEALYEQVVASSTVEVTIPLAKQFWGGSMGGFTDKYSIAWMLHSQPYSKLEVK